jgi:hypothetical protein
MSSEVEIIQKTVKILETSLVQSRMEREKLGLENEDLKQVIRNQELTLLKVHQETNTAA